MFYGKHYNVGLTVTKRLEAVYVKYIEIFFSYDRRCNVTNMFVELGLPMLDTVMHIG